LWGGYGKEIIISIYFLATLSYNVPQHGKERKRRQKNGVSVFIRGEQKNNERDK
jgi:hypothetical protein